MYLSSSLEELLPSLFRVLKLEAQDVAAARLLVDVLQDLYTLQDRVDLDMLLVDLDMVLDIPAILVLVIQEDLLRLV